MRRIVRLAVAAGLAGLGCSVMDAQAAGLCDAASVASILAEPGTLIPNPTHLGCDYNLGKGGKVSVMVTVQTDSFSVTNFNDSYAMTKDEKISGVGDAAWLGAAATFQGTTVQTLNFRAGRKIISVSTGSLTGPVSKDAFVKLGALFAAKG